MADSFRLESPRRPATGQEILDLIGPVKNETIAAILFTRASSDEILQAVDLWEEDHYTMQAHSRHMSDRIRRIYEILDYEQGMSE